MPTEWQLVLATLLMFWGGLMIMDKIFNLKRYGLDVLPFFLIWKTTKLNNFLSNTALKFPRAWHILGDVSIPLSYSALGYGIYLLSLNLMNAFFHPQQSSPIVPLIPGVTITWFSFIYALVGVVVTLVFHEMAHGIAARAEEIPIKSSGVLLLLLLPGGFVEIDDEAMKKKRTRSKLRILSSGSATNIATALLVLLLIANFQAVISPGYGPSVGVVVTNVDSQSFAYGELAPSTVLFAINGTPIWSPTILDLYLLNVKPFDTLRLTTSMGEVTVIAGMNPRAPYKGYIGILYPQPFYLPYPSSWWLGYMFPNHLYMVLQWVFIVSFSVSIVNMMPIPAFDGDKIFQEIVNVLVAEKKKTPVLGKEISTRKLILNVARTITVCFLALNFIVPILVSGFTPL